MADLVDTAAVMGALALQTLKALTRLDVPEQGPGADTDRAQPVELATNSITALGQFATAQALQAMQATSTGAGVPVDAQPILDLDRRRAERLQAEIAARLQAAAAQEQAQTPIAPPVQPADKLGAALAAQAAAAGPVPVLGPAAATPSATPPTPPAGAAEIASIQGGTPVEAASGGGVQYLASGTPPNPNTGPVEAASGGGVQYLASGTPPNPNTGPADLVDQAARELGAAAAQLGQKLPSVGDILEKAIKDLAQRIRDQGGPLGVQAPALQALKDIQSGKIVMPQSAREHIEGTTASAYNNPANRLVGELKNASTGIRALGAQLAGFSRAATVGFAAAAASLGGLVKASNPSLFTTLAQSATLLAASLGTGLTGPLVRVAGYIQQAATWARNLDPALKANVATWALWGTAAMGAVATVSKLGGLVSGVLPVLGALKTALVISVGNPFGMLLTGLAMVAIKSPEAFTPLLQAARQLGDALGGSLGNVLLLFDRLAGAIASVATPAVEAIAVVVRSLADGITYLNGALGPVSSTLLRVAIAAVAFASPLRLAIAAAIALINVCNQFGPVAGAVASALVGVGAAAWAMSTAMAATPMGATVVAIGAVTGALWALGGAYGAVGRMAEEMSRKLAEQKRMLDTLSAGGKVTKTMVEEVLTPAERERLTKAKTPEERKRALEKSLRNAEAQESAFPTKKAEEISASVMTELEAVKKSTGFWPADRHRERHAAIERGLIKSGHYTPEQAAKTAANLMQAGNGFTNLWGGGLASTELSAELLKQIEAHFTGTSKENEFKIEVLKQALGQDVFGDKGGKGAAPDQTNEERLQQMSGRRTMFAFSKEIQPQALRVEDVRQTVINAGLGMNQIELQMLEIQREQYREMLKHSGTFASLDTWLKSISKGVNWK